MPTAKLTTRRQSLTGLIWAVVVFVFLDAAVLALNLWTSWKVEEDAVSINLAGRQRMLSQRMAKASLQMVSFNDAAQQAQAYQELTRSATLFNQTLTAFVQGGPAMSGDNREIELPQLNDADAYRIAMDARQVWEPVYRKISKLTWPQPNQSEPVVQIMYQLTASNQDLLNQMNRLTSRIESASHEGTQLLRRTQAVAFVLALINFLVIVFMMLKRYKSAAEKNQSLNHIIDQLAVGVCLLDEKNRILGLNSAAATLLGYPPESLRGQLLESLLKMEDGVRFGNRPNGEHWVAKVSIGQVELDERPVKIATIQEITETYYNNRKLEYQAQHDVLTGLPNRRLFEDRFRIALAHAKRQRTVLGLALIDMDGFKPINDTYGHAAGDQVLQSFAERLRSCVRESDTVARLGGDEFVCLLQNLTDRNDLMRFAARLGQALQPPVVIEGVPIQMKASLGMSLYPQNGSEIADLMHQADEAMYDAKSKRNGFAIAPVQGGGGNHPAKPVR